LIHLAAHIEQSHNASWPSPFSTSYLQQDPTLSIPFPLWKRTEQRNYSRPIIELEDFDHMNGKNAIVRN